MKPKELMEIYKEVMDCYNACLQSGTRTSVAVGYVNKVAITYVGIVRMHRMNPYNKMYEEAKINLEKILRSWDGEKW